MKRESQICALCLFSRYMQREVCVGGRTPAKELKHIMFFQPLATSQMEGDVTFLTSWDKKGHGAYG